MFNRVASLRVTVYYSIIASTNDAWSDLSLVCNVNRFKLLMIFVVMSLTTMLMEGLKLLYFYPIIVLFNIGVLNSIGGGTYIDTSTASDVFFEIIYPPELEYTYKLRPAKDFGAPFNASFLEEGIPLVPTDPPHGCQVAKNAKELKGRIALVERGDCSFFAKSIIAEKAGAKAVIIADFHPSSIKESITNSLWTEYYYIDMIRDDTIPSTKTVNIPAGFLLGRNGKMIRQTLKRLNQPFALINIPVNFTYLDKLHQRPWLFW
ncbi:PRADC1-like protein [Bombus affinis]|uniref:PRADC1-like protein n=1 Tax=Bombus terrestris TaxID=30195 RepID=A0A9B0F659_BOMTE|nr:PRADC1-like protein [Bombus terrestris]XP_050594739.1 PRADC1-like protein [Bombus affinis]